MLQTTDMTTKKAKESKTMPLVLEITRTAGHKMECLRGITRVSADKKGLQLLQDSYVPLPFTHVYKSTEKLLSVIAFVRITSDHVEKWRAYIKCTFPKEVCRIIDVDLDGTAPTDIKVYVKKEVLENAIARVVEDYNAGGVLGNGKYTIHYSFAYTLWDLYMQGVVDLQ